MRSALDELVRVGLGLGALLGSVGCTDGSVPRTPPSAACSSGDGACDGYVEPRASRAARDRNDPSGAGLAERSPLQDSSSAEEPAPTATHRATPSDVRAVEASSGRASEVKIAVLGDTGIGPPFVANLRTILDEHADFVLHVGDFDYEEDPDRFWAVIDRELGHEFPYFLAVGNHDVAEWNAYSRHMLEHLSQNDVALDDLDLSDETYATTFRGAHVAVVGQNGNNAQFARFIDRELDEAEPEWKICVWHKNQTAMQLGRKHDEMGWDVYETCRLKGALILTGHEHSYERTKTLVSMQQQLVDLHCATPNELCVGPGRTFAVVQGLGGNSIRTQRRCLPTTYPYGCNGEWAFVYTRQQSAEFGTLFLVLNADGDAYRARGYFKTIRGEVVDRFTVLRDAPVPGAS